MPGHLEIWKSAGPELFVLDSDAVTAGKAASNDVVLAGDGSVSRMHAVFERFDAGWCIRDLGSKNGTFVNGERIWAQRVLHRGDEVRLGAVRIVFRGEDALGLTATQGVEGPPEMTRRERDVLLELCRPLASGDVFTEPASQRDIAAKLFVSEAAVKQHLMHLYDKFAIYETGERRRVRLANEAIRRGAVNLTELR